MHRLFDPVIARSARLGAGLDWKTSLQELTAVKMLGVPDYQVEESGPDHQKSFRAVVRVGGQPLGSGQGRTKKEAEQQAAEAAWRGHHGRAGRAGQGTGPAPPSQRPTGERAAPPGAASNCLSCRRSRRSVAASNITW